MKKLSIILVITSLFCLSLCDNLPVIDVYIESLCPDCMDFIGGSFKNVHLNKDHDKLAIVNFYPYGNANEKWNGDRWEFTCQHGENECFGNTLETCALNKMNKNEGHDLLICIEGNIRRFNKDFPQTLDFCVSDENLRRDIINCANSKEGNDLEHEVAQTTPQHNYVPWIHFNGAHDKEIENKILSNMLQFLCDLQGETKVEGCSQVLHMHSTNLVEMKTCHHPFHHEQLKFLN